MCVRDRINQWRLWWADLRRTQSEYQRGYANCKKALAKGGYVCSVPHADWDDYDRGWHHALVEDRYSKGKKLWQIGKSKATGPNQA